MLRPMVLISTNQSIYTTVTYVMSVWTSTCACVEYKVDYGMLPI